MKKTKDYAAEKRMRLEKKAEEHNEVQMRRLEYVLSKLSAQQRSFDIDGDRVIIQFAVDREVVEYNVHLSLLGGAEIVGTEEFCKASLVPGMTYDHGILTVYITLASRHRSAMIIKYFAKAKEIVFKYKTAVNQKNQKKHEMTYILSVRFWKSQQPIIESILEELKAEVSGFVRYFEAKDLPENEMRFVIEFKSIFGAYRFGYLYGKHVGKRQKDSEEISLDPTPKGRMFISTEDVPRMFIQTGSKMSDMPDDDEPF